MRLLDLDIVFNILPDRNRYLPHKRCYSKNIGAIVDLTESCSEKLSHQIQINPDRGH